jgi:hypothetical protein
MWKAVTEENRCNHVSSIASVHAISSI